MQIFELHFNPENKEGKVIDSFCYQPKDVYEKRLGALAIAGELEKSTPENQTLLNNLAENIKKTFHALPTRSQEEALRKSLTEGNSFLNKQENWQNKLSVAVLTVKNNKLQFSRIGNLKILLSRNKEITDIGKNADKSKSSFSSIVSGKVKKQDKLILLTEEIYDKFVDSGLLIDIAQADSISEKELDKISKYQEEKFPKTPGICLLIDFSLASPQTEKIVNKDTFSFKKFAKKTGAELKEVAIFLAKNIKEYSVNAYNFSRENLKPALINIGKLTQVLFRDLKRGLKKLFNVIKKGAKETYNSSKKKIQKTSTAENNENKKENEQVNKKKKVEVIKNKINELITSFTSINFKEYLPSINIPEITLPEDKEKRRNLYLAGLLLLIILTGSLFASNERAKQLKEQREALSQIEEEVKGINLNEEDAFKQLRHYHQNVNSLLDQGVAYSIRATNIKKEIEQDLLEVSKANIIEEPNVVFETSEIVATKINLVNNSLYLNNPYLSNVEKYNLETKEQLIRPVPLEDGGIYSISELNSKPLFFSSPDLIIDEENNKYEVTSPYEKTDLTEMKSFNSYIYFLEKENNQILRYHISNLSEPTIWIKERKPGNIISIAIDGSIWTLKDNNQIWKYEDNQPVIDSLIELDNIYPYPKKFTKLKTSNDSPLFVLEPRNKRLLILSKEGTLREQFIFPNAKNLKDFTVVNKKIYLLDGQKVYSIDF